MRLPLSCGERLFISITVLTIWLWFGDFAFAGTNPAAERENPDTGRSPECGQGIDQHRLPFRREPGIDKDVSGH